MYRSSSTSQTSSRVKLYLSIFFFFRILDNNNIANASAFSQDDYTGQSAALYDAKVQSSKPFKGAHKVEYL